MPLQLNKLRLTHPPIPITLPANLLSSGTLLAAAGDLWHLLFTSRGLSKF